MPDFKAKMHQIRFRLRLRPDSAGGAYSAPPDPVAYRLVRSINRYAYLSSSFPAIFSQYKQQPHPYGYLVCREVLSWAVRCRILCCWSSKSLATSSPCCLSRRTRLSSSANKQVAAVIVATARIAAAHTVPSYSPGGADVHMVHLAHVREFRSVQGEWGGGRGKERA